MPLKFSKLSAERLASTHPDLQRVFNEVLARGRDCTVLEGARTPERQRRLVAEGKSKTLNSKHLTTPSRAVDVAPFPFTWGDVGLFVDFGRYVVQMAQDLGVSLRWGGDWDGDGDRSDQTFNDLVHFELR